MTNPTMPASDELSERMAALLGSTPWEKRPSVIAEQIRQAEQAARADERRKTLELDEAAIQRIHDTEDLLWERADGTLWIKFTDLLLVFRALSKSSEPGEMADLQRVFWRDVAEFETYIREGK